MENKHARTAEILWKGHWRKIDLDSIKIDDIFRFYETDGTLLGIFRATRSPFFDPAFGCKAIQGKPIDMSKPIDMISLRVKSIQVSEHEFEFLSRIVT